MRALTTLLAILAAACGSVPDLGECSRSTDCAAGTYCARTPDGNVCWPDAVPPAVSDVTVSCDSDPCLRSGALHVEANVSDDAEVLGAEVTLDSGGSVAMSRSAGKWVADVSLREFPFDYVEHAVTVTVTALDGARNDRSVDAEAVAVTRIAWEKELEPGTALTTPVVMDDGTVAVAAANHRVYLTPWDGEGLESISVGTLQITAAPLALDSSVWIGSEDGRVYEAKNVSGAWIATERADTGGAIRGSLAATGSSFVIATSEFGVVYAIPPAGAAKNSGIGSPFTLGPVVDESDSVFAVAGGTVRRLTLTFGIPGDVWNPAVTLGASVDVALASADALLAPASNGSNGLLTRVTDGGDPQLIATTAVPSGGVAVLADGTMLVPEVSKTLTRITSTGAMFEGWHRPDLGSGVRTPLVLNDAGAPFVVSTAKGAVHALRPNGMIAWSGQIAGSNIALQPGNIYTPPDQPPGPILSTAYFAGADGVLHAVIVDGALDESAPWPKAFHDPQNTNRAGPQP